MFTMLVWKGILFGKCGNFAQSQDEKMHFWALSRLRQSGCKWNNELLFCTLHVLRTNLILPGKWKKSLKVQKVEVVNSTIGAIFTPCHRKNLAIDSLSDFPPKTFYFEVFPKTNAVSITFGLRYIHGQSLKELISDAKRSGPVFWETLS